MSWSASNITTGNYSIAASGSNCIAGTAGILYSTNTGQTWTSASGAPNLNTLAMDGSNVVGCIVGPNNQPIYYSSNSGQSYAVSSTSFIGGHRCIAISGSNAVAGRSDGIWYSTNGGQTWTVSNVSFNCGVIAMGSSTNGIASSTSENTPLYYTTNGGQTWTMSNITSGIFSRLVCIGSYAIAARNTSGLLYSTDSGQTWTTSNISTGTWQNVSLDSTGRALASSTSSSVGIYYSSNGGQTWTQSSTTTTGNYLVSINGTGGIAGATSGSSTSGMLYTTNGGQNWTLSDYTTQKFNAVILSGSNALSSVVSSGLAYSTGPLCFHRDTVVLCENGQYRPIHELTAGDRVQTYKHGLVPIKYIASSSLINGLFCAESAFLYRHRKTGLMVSGEHRMLVEPDSDVFSEEARTEQKRRYGLDVNTNANDQVDGLLMWMACLHPDFEKVDACETFHMFHLVLEHDNEPMRHYGIFVNGGIIAETCHEADFYKITRSNTPSAPSQQQQQQQTETTDVMN